MVRFLLRNMKITIDRNELFCFIKLISNIVEAKSKEKI